MSITAGGVHGSPISTDPQVAFQPQRSRTLEKSHRWQSWRVPNTEAELRSAGAIPSNPISHSIQVMHARVPSLSATT
eukprot:2104197-Rhodomonas_salina.2